MDTVFLRFTKDVNVLLVGIVLFKSLINSKRGNKGNFTSKSNSNKIMLCGQHHLVLHKISTL